MGTVGRIYGKRTGNIHCDRVSFEFDLLLNIEDTKCPKCGSRKFELREATNTVVYMQDLSSCEKEPSVVKISCGNPKCDFFLIH